MPNKNPEVARECKREWYLRNKEEILKRKRERRAAQKKPKPPPLPKPAPTPEQIARRRQLNKEACYRYRATHLAQVRWINRDYYHRNRDRLVQQQREWRALVKQNKQTPMLAMSSRLFGGDSGTSTGGRHRRSGGPCPCTGAAASGEGARWGGGDRTCSGGRNGSRSAGGSGGDGACSGGRDRSGLSSGGEGGAVVVVGAVPVPATGGRLNIFTASSTLTG